jgi:hypothetical protein
LKNSRHFYLNFLPAAIFKKFEIRNTFLARAEPCSFYCWFAGWMNVE